ncbi:zinc-ribbon metal-binding protein lunapark isoform X1 [Dermacentor variabilis]|uniref:zinc-ribbon metal-binding protein lunapark isoform X1 n=1 Tax=Dermacentor variabilis TaxID=34621 RepID=UPI003F5BCCE0
MGILWSRFKNKPGTKELLDDIEKKVRNINEYKLNTERQQKRLVGALIFYSCLFYILCMVITYVWYFPRTLQGQILCIVPLVLFPAVIVLTKKLLQWYFRRKIERKNEELTDLIKQKRSVLDNVMETETYKVAKEILEKYDPETLRKSVKLEEKTVKPLLGTDPDLRRRMIPQSIKGTPMRPGARLPHSNLKMPSSSLPNAPFEERRMMVVAPGMSRNGQQAHGPLPVPTLPRPILPRERTAFDRVIDFLVGEGPSNRYALICTRCCSHNGMALKEEYEYLSFRCCYCFHWNQAKKQRPELPRVLEMPPAGMLALPSPPPAATVPAEESSITVNNPSSEKDADETDMETCDEGFESKVAKDEGAPDDSLPAAKILPVDASGDILGLHEIARQPKQAVVAPLPKNPQCKKDD